MARKKQTARQRGYFPRSEVAASLRAMASHMEQERKEGNSSLIKMSLNMWFTPDDEIEPVGSGGEIISQFTTNRDDGPESGKVENDANERP